MNDLFHELYGAYYAAAERLISEEELTWPQMYQMLEEYLSPDGQVDAAESIRNQEWDFLEAGAKGYHARTGVWQRPLTELQKAFLRTALEDPRSRVFLSTEQLSGMKAALGDGETLYAPSELVSFDRAAPGDPYDEEDYCLRVRQLLSIMNSGGWAEIGYLGAKGSASCSLCRPIALEYSSKDDRFRVKAADIHGGIRTLNAARITSVMAADAPDQPAPVISAADEYGILNLRVLPERNGTARFLQEFSYLRKETLLDETTGIADVKLWYPKSDETEILIRLLGFGPVVQVLEPKAFVQRMRIRVLDQNKRLRR